jgi:prepilin-type N-terminal cleavage/methylation domain-containing protein
MTGTPKRERHEAGFTLMELVVVMMLAGVVTLGLVVFYLNSQAIWMDSSSQALAQRDATTLIDVMRAKAAGAAQVLLLPVAPDSVNHLVIFYDKDSIETDRFFWDPADSLVHHGEGADGDDRGPVMPTMVERFHLSLDASLLPLVSLDTLRVHSTTGQVVQMSTTMALYNGTP